MGNLFKVLGARIVGGLAAAAAGWIFVHTKGIVQVDATQVVEIGSTMLGTYAASHRILSRWTNPGDAAKGRLADAEKVAVDTGTVVQPAPPISR